MAAKWYGLFQVDAHDAEAHNAYQREAVPALERIGAKFVTRAGRSEAVGGSTRTRTSIIEFEDFASAVDCRSSAAYLAAKA